MTLASASLLLRDPDHGAALAGFLAPRFRAADVLLLDGPIGAGKTHFARALIQQRLAQCGVIEDVPSPTFTLVQVYEAGALEIWHSDLYRLPGPSEVRDLGLEEAMETALCLIEWPDRLGPLTPPGALHLHFAVTPGDQRLLTARGDAQRWGAVLQAITDFADG